nr:immunoglobulin light chain junction region [Macaca mulatta]
CQQESDWNHTF